MRPSEILNAFWQGCQSCFQSCRTFFRWTVDQFARCWRPRAVAAEATPPNARDDSRWGDMTAFSIGANGVLREAKTSSPESLASQQSEGKQAPAASPQQLIQYVENQSLPAEQRLDALAKLLLQLEQKQSSLSAPQKQSIQRKTGNQGAWTNKLIEALTHEVNFFSSLTTTYSLLGRDDCDILRSRIDAYSRVFRVFSNNTLLTGGRQLHRLQGAMNCLQAILASTKLQLDHPQHDETKQHRPSASTPGTLFDRHLTVGDNSQLGPVITPEDYEQMRSPHPH